MNNIELLVGSDHLPLDTKDIGSVSIVKRLKDISEYTKSAASYSKPITVLQTLRTKEVFGTLFNINTTLGFDVTVKQPVLLKENGITVLSGYLKLTKITRRAYEVIVYSSVSSITSVLGDKLIKGNSVSSDDIVINPYTQEMTIASIVDAMQYRPVANGTGIRVGYMGIENSHRYLPLEPANNYPMMPSTAVREVLEAIIESTGYTMHLSTEIENSIKSMYMPYNGAYEDFTKSLQYAEFETLYTSLKDLSYYDIEGGIYGIKLTRDDINGIGIPAPYDEIEILEPGKYIYEFTVKARKTTTANPPATSTVLIKSNVINKTDYSFPENSKKSLVFGDPEITFDNLGNFVTKTFTSDEFEVTERSYIFTGFETYFIEDSLGVNANIKIDPTGTTFKLTKVDSWYHNTDITANEILPLGYKQADLFNDVLTMYNAQVTIDGTDIYIDSFNDFYNTVPEYLDWTKKMDVDSFELEPLVNLAANSFKFEMGESGDRLSSKFLDSSGVGVNDLLITGHSEVSGDTNETFSIVAANNPVVDSDDDSIAIVSLMTGYIENDVIEYKTDYPARIVILDSIPNTQSFGINGAAIQHLHYYTDKISNGDDDDLILSFNSEYVFRYEVIESNRTLYNRFYKTDIESLIGNKFRLTADFRLRAKDVAIKFTDKIFINDDDFGSAYFKLNQLKNYSTDESKLATTELTQVDRVFTEAEFDDTIFSTGV